MGELGVKRESCLQWASRVKKPRPEGHEKYLSPPNVPSEHADCSSSCNTSNITLTSNCIPWFNNNNIILKHSFNRVKVT